MRKFKHLWITLMTVILAVSLIAGGAGMSALAAYTLPAEAVVISTTGLVLPSSVKLGKPIKLGTTDYASNNITVKAPNGSNATIVDGDTEEDYVETKMVGNYTIKYSLNGKSYEHNVNVKLDGTFEFRVKDDGASLPTFVSPETDVTLPEAALYKLNEDTNEYEKYTGVYNYDIYINNVKQERVEGKYAPVKFAARTHSVQYICTYEGTKQNFVKEYTVKSQTGFVDNVSPKMSISGVPLQGSLNTKITLPKATATDDYDTNVRIVISVKHNNAGVLADVLRVELDDYGYAKNDYKNGDGGTEKVDFDNVYNLSFYPRELGDYLIEYQAFDDAGNSSVKQPETLVVSDRSAPKLEKIADSQIPSKWGKSVKTIASEAANASQPYVADQKITFPRPVYSDNSLSENIKVSFEIRDTVNNNVVLKFDNIYEYTLNDSGVKVPSGGAKYVYDDNTPLKGLYRDTNATFGEGGFDFYFSKYLVDNAVPTGKYTATYQASDAKPNITSKSYDITLEETFDDTVAPTVTVEADEYIFVTSEDIEYTLPTAKITDAIDANPTVKYLLKTTGGATIVEVENGSEIKINDSKITYDKKDYDHTGDIVIEVLGIDDVNNEGTSGDKLITVVSSDDITDNITLGIVGTGLRNSSDELSPGTTFVAGTEAKLGSLTINGVDADANDRTYRKFLGFELTLQNPDDKVISGLSLETYYKKVVAGSSAGAIKIDNIAFTPSVEGPYTLTVRAFDVSGRSIINVYTFNVNPGTGTTPEISATPIPTTGSIQMNYKLKNETIKNPVNVVGGADGYVVRKISNAGKFSLMGIEFTAYSTGSYNFIDGYYVTSGGDADGFKKHESYTLAVSDTSSPVFSLIDRMPTHWEKAKELILPEVIAFNDYANAKIDISVSSPAGNLNLGTQLKQITAADATNLYEGKYENQYRFTPELDGEYTVTYTASVNNSTEVKQYYKIKVGDVIAPSFKLETSHPSTATQDGEFKFSIILYETNANEDKIENVTFTKKLIDPSGETVYTASATGTTGRDKVYDSTDKAHKYSMSGTYTVEYTATDKVGNVSTIKETIVVSASGRVSSAPLKILRNVLIIVGIILLGGVIVYFARYYGKGNVKHKSAKESSKRKLNKE